MKFTNVDCFIGGRIMRITYKKLWKLLIDREMNKQDLKRECNISSASRNMTDLS